METRAKIMMIFTIVVAFLQTPILFDSALASPVPDTGQTKCYDNDSEITCSSPGQDFYGQDAQYGTNLQSYTKLDENGNDLPDEATEWVMVRDNVTGLIWEMKDSKDDTPNYDNPHDADNTYTWYDGITGIPGDGTDTLDFITALNDANFGGHNDWRLPTIKELSTIVDSSIPYPGPTINTDYFPNTVSDYYWSSTTIAGYPYSAWVVGFYLGDVYYGGKSANFYVRAVRSGQWGTNNFVDNGDGTITDTSTGLMWEVKTDDGRPRDKDNVYTWEQSLAYADTLTLSGYNDWRLPNRNELQSIVDYDRYNPSIDPIFSYTVSSYYWSSTTYAGYPYGAWGVYFYIGCVGGLDDKSSYVYVRAVRGGQCGEFGDSDGDTVCDDGDTSGIPGDNPCTGGEKLNCDDNCPSVPNSNQEDADSDGRGDACEACVNKWWGDWTGWVVTNETSRTAQACHEAFETLFNHSPDRSGPCYVPGPCDGTSCGETFLPEGCDGWGEYMNLLGNITCENEIVCDSGEWSKYSYYIGRSWYPGETYYYDGSWDVYCGIDTDSDSLPDNADNCPYIGNPTQADTFPPQGNGIGDACDCEANFDCDCGAEP